MSALIQYEDSLTNYPARGSGLHQHIMRVANLGVFAKIPHDEIIRDMDSSFDGIKGREAHDAVRKAASTIFTEKYEKRVVQKQDINLLDKFIDGYPTDIMELVEASHNRLTESPEDDARLLLNVLYEPDEMLFIGDVFGRKVQPTSGWLNEDLSKFPHIIPNPMTGKEGLTDMAKISYRCEATVADLRYAVCEMDDVPIEKQVAFWMRCIMSGVPVAAIIHSGSKSLHGWVKVDCGTDGDKWDEHVRGWLFETFGARYGLDPACKTKARLSRLPGHHREGKELQRLLYLNEDA